MYWQRFKAWWAQRKAVPFDPSLIKSGIVPQEGRYPSNLAWGADLVNPYKPTIDSRGIPLPSLGRKTLIPPHIGLPQTIIPLVGVPQVEKDESDMLLPGTPDILHDVRRGI